MELQPSFFSFSWFGADGRWHHNHHYFHLPDGFQAALELACLLDTKPGRTTFWYRASFWCTLYRKYSAYLKLTSTKEGSNQGKLWRENNYTFDRPLLNLHSFRQTGLYPKFRKGKWVIPMSEILAVCRSRISCNKGSLSFTPRYRGEFYIECLFDCLCRNLISFYHYKWLTLL